MVFNCRLGLDCLNALRNHLKDLVVTGSSAEICALTEATAARYKNDVATGKEGTQTAHKLLSAMSGSPCEFQLSPSTEQFKAYVIMLEEKLLELSLLLKEIEERWVHKESELKRALKCQLANEKLQKVRENVFLFYLRGKNWQ